MTYHIRFLTFAPAQKSAPAYYTLANELLQRSSPLFTKAAIQAFSRAIELDACFAAAYAKRGSIRLAVAQQKIASGVTIGLRKKLLKSIDDFTRYIFLQETDSAIYHQRAKAYLLLIRYDKYAATAFLEDYEAAKRLGHDVSDLSKDLAWVGLQAARQNGDYQRALHYLDLAYQNNYDHNYFIRRSIIFEEMGMPEEAAADVLRASSKSLLSRAFERAALFDEAEQILLAEVEKAPQNMWPKIRLAQFYERIGALASAIDTYQFILQQLANSHRYYQVIEHEIHRLALASN